MDESKEIQDNTPIEVTEAAADTAQQPLTTVETQAETNIDNTPNMEVHHPHHVHHKKKWQDYLFEFFMLFLAVTAGFFVENQREHYVENERAKEYAIMLRRDLISDTVIMDIIVNYRAKQEKKYDSLLFLIDNTPFEKIDQKNFLKLASNFGEYRQIIPNNATLQQMKSSGSLRYFKNTNIIFELNSYEEDLKHKEFFQAEEKQHYTERVIPFIIQHFNFRLADSLPSIVATQNFPGKPLVNFDQKTMMEFYYLLKRTAWFNKEMGKADYEKHKQKAVSIISLLDKEYPAE